MASITHVIFDLDDLLIDSEYLFDKCIDQILEEYNKSFTFDVKQKYLGQSYTDTIIGLIAEFRLPITVQSFVNLYQSIKVHVLKNVELKPGAKKLVYYLWKNNIPMAIASGSAEDSFDLKTVEYPNIFSKIHHKVCSGSDKAVKRSKPAPDIFIEAALRFTENPPLSSRNILVFEDAANGIKGALAANMKAVWVPDPRTDISIFENHPDVTILTSLELFSPGKFNIQEQAEYYFI